jgi:hypothetical protein
MLDLQFSNEELEVLKDLLEQSAREMELELVHTDNHSFKQMLKHRRDVLEGIRARLSALEAAA